MASYTLTMTNPGWCSGKFTVTHELSSNKRNVTVTVSLKLWRSDGGTSYNYDASKNFYIKIGTSTIYYTIEKVAGTSGVTKTRSRTVALDPDGTLSLAVKVGGSLSGTTFKINGNNSKTYKITGGAKKTYAISYDANGGEGAPSSQTKTYGTALTLRSGTPTRDTEDGTTYTFSKWKSSYDGSYHYPSGSYTTNAATTMTAVWKTTTGYEITYDLNGTTDYPATGTATDSIVSVGRSFTTAAAPNRTGYNFTGWFGTTYTSGAISGKTYSANQSVTPSGDMTLTAQWTAWTHTVAFNANGGSGTLPSSFRKTTAVSAYIENASESTDTVPTRSGYVFLEWNSKSDGTGTSYQPGDEYKHTQNGGTVTLYAIWISTDIYLYSTGKCKAIEFVEGGSTLAFYDNGEVGMPQFVEGSSISITSSKFTVSELIEK